MRPTCAERTPCLSPAALLERLYWRDSADLAGPFFSRRRRHGEASVDRPFRISPASRLFKRLGAKICNFFASNPPRDWPIILDGRKIVRQSCRTNNREETHAVRHTHYVCSRPF